jgi:glycosyltransferase involved in cell wall biosynthesis
MKYKLGIVLLEPESIQGGTSTFSDTMRDYLNSIYLDDETKIIINSGGRNSNKNPKSSHTISLNLRYRDNLWLILPRFISNRLINLLKPHYKPTLFDTYSLIVTEKLRKTGCDFFWFVTPPPFVVDLASVSPIYNLAHLEFPWISDFGKNMEWQNREKYFRLLTSKSYKIIFTDNHHAQIAKQNYNLDSNKILIKSFPTPIIKCNLSLVAIEDTLSRFNLLHIAYFIYPANFWEHKNHLFLIRVLQELMGKNFDFKMIFTGSDPDQYLSKIAKAVEDSGFSDRIKILNFVNRDDLVHLIKGSKGLVFPSLITPDSIPELEANFLKVPFIKGTFKSKSVDIKNNVVSLPFTRKDLWVQVLQDILDGKLTSELSFNGEEFSPKTYFNTVREVADQFANEYLA